MSYQNPVGGVPDPYEGYRVEGSGDRQAGGGGGPPGEEPPESRGLLAHFFKILQKKIDAIFSRIGGMPTQSFGAKKTLRALKTCLEILKLEDRSQDVNFLNELALNWNFALEESLQWNEEAATLFKIFAKKILHYPENQTHTFGYYLTEHAGQKWVPFPYMELVQKIHYEHEKNPSSSSLTEWTRLLDDTMKTLQGNLS